jgi:hypothetical protein
VHLSFATFVSIASTAAFPEGTAYAQNAEAAVDAAAEAKRQFGLGRQAFDAKRYADAAQNFEAAAAYKPHPVTFYTAAVAWELAGRSDRAADAFSRAVEQPGLREEDARKSRERLSSLEGVLGTVTVTAPDGWKVQLDGNVETTAPARLHAKPGLRTLVYRAPGKAVEKKEVTLEAGQKVAISLPEPTPQVVAQPEPPKEPKTPVVTEAPAEDPLTTIRKSAGLVLAGIGAASVGASIIFWTQAQDARDVYNAKPTQQGLDHGHNLETWTNVTLIGGLVLLAGGVTLYLLPMKSKTAIAVGATPHGGMLRGQF